MADLPSDNRDLSTFSEQDLRRLAGAKSFRRGVEYLEAGLVTGVTEQQGVVSGTVQGGEEYTVSLAVHAESTEYSCSCPLGVDGIFCKHCVALGLAWLRRSAPAEAHEASDTTHEVPPLELRGWLLGLEKAVLADLLLDLACRDDTVWQRLQLLAIRQAAGAEGSSGLRRAIDRAAAVSDFIDYRGVSAFAAGIGDVIADIEALLRRGLAGEVIELAEHALERVEAAMSSVDDSDGDMGGLLERLQSIHLAACELAKPDPEALARRLLKWELRSQWDVFRGAAATYAEVLGEKGLSVYRTLAEAEWVKLPAVKPGDECGERWERFRITHIMETLASQRGDLEELVAIKSHDLSAPFDFLEIARLYAQAGDGGRALEWAEQGMRAFPAHRDARLRDFVAEEYHKRARHEDAMTLVWNEFAAAPGLESFEKLRSHAKRCGQWPAWRERAIAAVRASIAEAKQQTEQRHWRWYGDRDASKLVMIFLSEKDPEAAWREAKEGGCHAALWLQLAKLREREHPEDALTVYQQQVGPTIELKNNEAYREVIALLRKIRALLCRLGREEEFGSYTAHLRLTHKRLRNFIKMLDHASWD